jgi:hypothetical protein
MTTPTHRLLIVFYDKVPSATQVHLALKDYAGVSRAALATKNARSEKAAMWTRDPLGCLPTGRLSVDADSQEIAALAGSPLAASLGGVAYLCDGTTPLQPTLTVGEAFLGTLQLCCFQRRAGLSPAALKQYWLDEHTNVALSTQNTLGYHQNRVINGGEPHFDGIVEEYFPPEASDSMHAFFADGDNETQMWEHIQKLTESSERFLDFERSELIHLSDTRII